MGFTLTLFTEPPDVRAMIPEKERLCVFTESIIRGNRSTLLVESIIKYSAAPWEVGYVDRLCLILGSV